MWGGGSGRAAPNPPQMVSAANAVSLLLRRSPREYNSPTTAFSRKEANLISRFAAPAAKQVRRRRQRWAPRAVPLPLPGWPPPAAGCPVSTAAPPAGLCPGGCPGRWPNPAGVVCDRRWGRQGWGGGRAEGAGSPPPVPHPRGLLPPPTPVRAEGLPPLLYLQERTVISSLRLGFKPSGRWGERAKLVYAFCLHVQIVVA